MRMQAFLLPGNFCPRQQMRMQAFLLPGNFCPRQQMRMQAFLLPGSSLLRRVPLWRRGVGYQKRNARAAAPQSK